MTWATEIYPVTAWRAVMTFHVVIPPPTQARHRDRRGTDGSEYCRTVPGHWVNLHPWALRLRWQVHSTACILNDPGVIR